MVERLEKEKIRWVEGSFSFWAADLHCLQAVLSSLLVYSYFFSLSLIVRYELGGKAKGVM